MSEAAAPNRNTLWARTLAHEWGRLGVSDICVGSGSRSAPLIEAFAGNPQFHLHSHVDERSAAFFALGIGAATGRPAVVVTTSGTAAANLLPAAVEASQGEIPLLLVTADRPAHLRGLDANQTIEQPGLFGAYPRLAIELGLPRPTRADLRRLRVAAVRAWAASVGVPCGPVHLNVPFEKPLEPVEVAGDVPGGTDLGGRDDGPWTRVRPRRPASAAAELVEALDGARRPLVVCGPSHDPEIGEAALRLASSLQAPVLADPLSGARFAARASDLGVPHADLALASSDAVSALEPDAIVRIGAAPTSATIQRYLVGHADARQIVIDGGGRWKDYLAVAHDMLLADPAATMTGAAGGVEPGEVGWADRWRAIGRAAAAVVEPVVGEVWFEGSVASAVATALPEGATWFVGNSMPIRDVDAFVPPRDRAVRALGLRGASGIDGNVSAALGAAGARGAPAAALLGDLTVLHDVGALLFARSRDVSLQIVVVQNRGGGIFHMLPIREHDPPFTPYVVMPHDVDLSAVAAAAGIPHRPVSSVADLADQLEAGWGAPGVRIIEAEIDRQENWARREEVAARVRAAVAAAL